MMQFTVVIKRKETCFFRSLFYNSVYSYLGFPGVSVVKNLEMQDMQETWFPSLGQEGPLEEGIATHYSILVLRIPWTEEPGGLRYMGSHRVGHE